MSKRFEARLASLPQQPREITQSSLTATPSREQLSPQVSFGQVLEATYKELTRTQEVMPRKKRFSRRITAIGLGTSNGVREQNFQELFPGLVLRRLEADEIHSGLPEIDARSKAISAARRERKKRSVVRDVLSTKHRKQHREEIEKNGKGLSNPYVSLDAVNVIPHVDAMNNVTFVQVGKPEREANEKGIDVATLIQNRFADLAKMAQENNWSSIPYLIEMATYIHNPIRRGKYNAYSVRKAVVMLDPHVIAYIASPEGFAQYQKLSEEPDKPNKPVLTKVAGGMKLETFEKMGAIQYVTGKAHELLEQSVPDDLKQRRFDRALRLAEGKLDLGFMRTYFSKYRLSDEQKRAGWTQHQNQPINY